MAHITFLLDGAGLNEPQEPERVHGFPQAIKCAHYGPIHQLQKEGDSFYSSRCLIAFAQPGEHLCFAQCPAVFDRAGFTDGASAADPPSNACRYET